MTYRSDLSAMRERWVTLLEERDRLPESDERREIERDLDRLAAQIDERTSAVAPARAPHRWGVALVAHASIGVLSIAGLVLAGNELLRPSPKVLVCSGCSCETYLADQAPGKANATVIAPSPLERAWARLRGVSPPGSRTQWISAPSTGF